MMSMGLAKLNLFANPELVPIFCCIFSRMLDFWALLIVMQW